MRPPLFALLVILLPLFSHAHEGHGSLGAHEHGVAQLDIALEGNLLELELHGPAMNVFGFEHAPRTPAEKARAKEVHAILQQPHALFGLAAPCQLTETQLSGPLLESAEAAPAQGAGHSDIHAHYRFRCGDAQAPGGIDLDGLFSAFPATEKVRVQLIGPQGQSGGQLTAAKPRIAF